jgi:flagellar assembly factor FliW
MTKIPEQKRVLRSRYFGEIEVDASAPFRFRQGLPGFESERDFAPIEIPAQRPILYLQSHAREDICLITLPVRVIVSGYSLHLPAEYLGPLGFRDDETPRIGEELLCLAVVTAGEDRRLTANLLAPIVVNIRTREAVQAIQYDSDYSHRHPIPENATC